MSLFIVPSINIERIENLGTVKEYLRDLNKKIRFLSENLDSDNFSPEEYQRFYGNENRASKLSMDLSEFQVRVEDYDKDIIARLKATASEIDLLVSKGDVTNQINIGTEKITFSGNHLLIQSDNLTLDADGNLSMKGEINATAGYFGGYQITNGYLADYSGTIETADLSGTDINVQNNLNIKTDVDISGCSIDFSGKTVKTEKSAYWGWFWTENVNVSGTVFANCGSADSVDCSGDIYCYDYWSEDEGIAYSDARLKTDIQEINPKEALDFLMKLRPVSYELKQEEGIHYGLIAQEVLETGDPYEMVESHEDGYYTVNYGQLHAIIAAAMQEQLKEMEELGVRI